MRTEPLELSSESFLSFESRLEDLEGVSDLGAWVGFGEVGVDAEEEVVEVEVVVVEVVVVAAVPDTELLDTVTPTRADVGKVGTAIVTGACWGLFGTIPSSRCCIRFARSWAK